MITIIVARPPADKTGPVIYDPLICSEPVAVERGRNEIDINCNNRVFVTLSGPLKQAFKPGALLMVSEQAGTTWRGMILDVVDVISRAEDGLHVSMSMRVERVL